MELFLAFNIDQWGLIDFFDPSVDLSSLKLSPLEEAEATDKLDLESMEPETRIVLL